MLKLNNLNLSSANFLNACQMSQKCPTMSPWQEATASFYNSGEIVIIYFLPTRVRISNDLPYTVFDNGTLDDFKGTVNRGCLPELCLLRFSVAQVLVGLRKQFIKNIVFPT